MVYQATITPKCSIYSDSTMVYAYYGISPNSFDNQTRIIGNRRCKFNISYNVAIAHLGWYTSDIGLEQWVNIVHETVCRQWFGVV